MSLPLYFLSFDTYRKVDQDGIIDNRFFSLKEQRIYWSDIESIRLSAIKAEKENGSSYYFEPNMAVDVKNEDKDIVLWDSLGWESPDIDDVEKSIRIIKESNVHFVVSPLSDNEKELIQNFKYKDDVINLFEYASSN